VKTIFKYQPGFSDRIEIMTHESAELLSVQSQPGRDPWHTLTFWFLVDTDKPIVPRVFRVYGTGHEIDLSVKDMIHVGSVQEMNGKLVWHCFESITDA
jgi:hypothetical protein